VLLVGSVRDEAHASSKCRICLRGKGCNVKDFWLAAHSLRYLSENEIESPWILLLNFQGQRTDGQSERMIQTLEYIMRAYVIDFGGSYHLSIRCAPFKALYGRKCRSPVLWEKIGESSLTVLELVQEMTDKVVLVKENPKR
ncbi:putative reverse transcriptase domain-containing protein, partial [Tanacetum coccineum]